MKHYNNKIIRSVTVSLSVDFFIGLVSTLREKGYEILVTSDPGPELEELKDMGIKVIEVPMERHISLARDFKSLLKLIKVFIEEKPYMVHSMTPKAGLLCMVAAWITQVPRRVHTFTGLVWPTSTGLSRKILMATDWLTCACATHVIPEGKGVMEDLQKYITKKPMKVLGYGNVRGVNMKYWSMESVPKDKISRIIQPDTFTFIYVGRIVGDKGLNELVKAFVLLNYRYSNTRLLIVGMYEEHLDPVHQETLDNIKTNLAINDVGPKYGDDLLAYYAASDCFVFPSYREGFPNVVLEAGAMGLPSIVTDINGSREIIENGKNGIIIPPKDVDALYKAMEQMLLHNEATKKMAENARPIIECRFEQSFVRKCMNDYYDEILKEK